MNSTDFKVFVQGQGNRAELDKVAKLARWLPI